MIDHVVVATPDLDRTIAAVEAGLGLPLLRTRDAGSAGAPMRQAFFRMGEVVLEVVGGAEPEPGGGPARFYGIAITVEDLDAAVDHAGDRIGQAQAGRATWALDRHLPQGGGVGRAGGAHEPVAGPRRALTVGSSAGRRRRRGAGMAALTTRRRPPPPAGPARPGPRRRWSAASTTGRSGRAGGRGGRSPRRSSTIVVTPSIVRRTAERSRATVTSSGWARPDSR